MVMQEVCRFVTKNGEETRQLGVRLAELLKPGDVLALEGGLGAGKTTFAQGIARGLGVEETVDSPTFTIIKEYESGFAANFWQIVAKLFSQDLKTRYDPKGKDAKIEELVQVWDAGQWDQFYYSVFWEAPVKTVINVDHLKSQVKKKGSKKR